MSDHEILISDSGDEDRAQESVNDTPSLEEVVLPGRRQITVLNRTVFLNLIVGFFSLIATGLSAYCSLVNLNASQGAVEAAQFLSMRERYMEISKHLPQDARLLEAGPFAGTEDWRSFAMYWEHAYTEWHLATKINNGQFRALWARYYEPVFRQTVMWPAFSDVLLDLASGEFNYPPRREFVDLMRQYYKESTGRDLSPRRRLNVTKSAVPK